MSHQNKKFTQAKYLNSANELLEKMTIQEKIGQLTLFGSLKEMKMSLLKEGRVGGLLNVYGASKVNELQRIAVEQTRLAIPLLIGDDVIHGFRTIFPIPLATASSFDMDAIERAETVAAREAYVSGINWIYAPMVDIARDPRWGRVAEGSGEDCYLGSQVARARVRGLQATNPVNNKPWVAACPKHFLGYGLAEGGRDYDGGEVSPRTLRDTYLPPFQAAIDEGAMSIMSSFNTLNGDPISGSQYYLTDVLRKEMGFEGMVVSDWESIMELIFHGVAADRKDAARVGVLAGNDMDMHSGVYADHLNELAKDSDIVKAIDESVVRILCIKYALGLFDNPYRNVDDENTILCDEFRSTARDVAKRSMVLLKNKNNVLPLNKKKVKVLVTGPLADSHEDMIGMWGCKGDRWDVVTLLHSLKMSGVPFEYIRGCEFERECCCDFEKAKQLANDCDVIVYACGEPQAWTGEIHCRTEITLPKIQNKYLSALKETGKPVVAVLMTGRPLCCTELEQNADAILLAWHPGIEAGNAVWDCLFGDYSPAGKLPITFPRATGQIPIYYSSLPSGRPYESFTRYLDCDVTPLYSFGYGLTYSEIQYSNLTLNKAMVKADDILTCSVTLNNIGSYDTEEVVQVYFRDVISSLSTPKRKLCAFKKVFITANSEINVQFELPVKDFAFIDNNLNSKLEAGKFELYVGTDSNCDYTIEFMVES